MKQYKLKLLPYALNNLQIGQRPLSIIHNGVVLTGQNTLLGSIGNLNEPTVELNENISTNNKNIENINFNVNSIIDFIDDFSEDDRTFLRFKNGWIPVNTDGSSVKMDYAIFRSVESRDNHIIPIVRYRGNSKLRTSSTFSMENGGLYKVSFSGYIIKETVSNPLELLCKVNGVVVDSILVSRYDNKLNFNGFMICPIKDSLDVIHFEISNELGITSSQKNVDLNFVLERIGDLEDV